jgi:hypothetical protein
MNTLLFNEKKDFSEDSRANYINFNKSDIFNKTVKVQENELVNVIIYLRILEI